jgi:hypothetical protein
MPENIINGPIFDGCFVRMRGGTEIGPVRLYTEGRTGVQGIMQWRPNGKFTMREENLHEFDVTEVLPARSAAPVEPSYEQKLWDEVAKETCGVNVSKGLLNPAKAAAETANIFMAERAKRMVK